MCTLRANYAVFSQSQYRKVVSENFIKFKWMSAGDSSFTCFQNTFRRKLQIRMLLENWTKILKMKGKMGRVFITTVLFYLSTQNQC